MLFTVLNAELKAITVITPIIAFFGGMTPFIVYLFAEAKENKLHLIEKFNDIYTKTFALRKKLSTICERQYSIKQFYYETDLMFDCADVKDCILDYLNEMEDLFYYVLRFRGLNKIFKKLMSYALYSRLIMFYGFILKLRKKNNDPTMFSNYVNVLTKIEKAKKIKMYLPSIENIYYIGIRESDIYYNDSFFKGSYAMFAKENINYTIRPNQNKPCHEFFPYLENLFHKNAINGTNRYMFYNANTAYGLSPSFQDKFICLNENALIASLNDKDICKTWLRNNNIPIIDFETKLGRDIIEDKTISNHYKTCVLQSNNGGGGIGTFVITKQNRDEILATLNPIKKYLLSSYIDNNVSVNTHIFISDKQTVLSPASVQIIELHGNQLCYRGADYFAFNAVAPTSKNAVKNYSLQIANLLRARGYRGVAGLDFLIDNKGNVYCTEINPRMQASSVLLDKFLSQTEKDNKLLAHSVYELNLQAFNNNMKTMLSFEDTIPYSCYYYYNDGLPVSYFQNKIERLQSLGITVDTDGLDFNGNFDADSYMFRATFPHALCGISPNHTLWINDNIRIVPLPQDTLQLKIALMNQGVILQGQEGVKKGVYESVDISLSSDRYGINDLDINCAVGIHYAQYSPFVLHGENSTLYYYSDALGEFTVEKDALAEFTEDERKILYIATDRLRIKNICGCEFKNRGSGCDFCNVPSSDRRYTPTEIINALHKLKQKNIPIRHILIGGGTCLNADIWNDIITIATFLQNDAYYKAKPISLMSIFPPVELLQPLKDAGISEVAFNLEIADTQLAQKHMRGKYVGKSRFYENMQQAIEVFGIGNVRSALLVGVDTFEETVHAAEEIANADIVPCLSALRILPNARLKGLFPPTNDYLRTVYEACVRAVHAASGSVKQLGPPCKRCGNNMLIF